MEGICAETNNNRFYSDPSLSVFCQGSHLYYYGSHLPCSHLPCSHLHGSHLYYYTTTARTSTARTSTAKQQILEPRAQVTEQQMQILVEPPGTTTDTAGGASRPQEPAKMVGTGATPEGVTGEMILAGAPTSNRYWSQAQSNRLLESQHAATNMKTNHAAHFTGNSLTPAIFNFLQNQFTHTSTTHFLTIP